LPADLVGANVALLCLSAVLGFLAHGLLKQFAFDAKASKAILDELHALKVSSTQQQRKAASDSKSFADRLRQVHSLPPAHALLSDRGASAARDTGEGRSRIARPEHPYAFAPAQPRVARQAATPISGSFVALLLQLKSTA
jgi:hypothetical protein